MVKTVEKYNDLIAGVYDAKTREFDWVAPMMATEVSRGKALECGRILDLGCGTAQILDCLRFPDFCHLEYTGVDISEKMLDIARKKYERGDFLKLDIDEIQNLESLPGTYDFVFMVGILEFLNAPEKIFEFIANKLPSGWHLCFTFETYVEWDAIQWSKLSPMGKIGDNIVAPITNFNNHRYSLGEVETMLWDQFETIDTKEFVAYYKTDKRLPIRYTLFFVRKK